MPIKTHKQADSAYEALKAFYREQINRAVEQAGSVNALAKQLGMAQQSVDSAIRRDKFASLRRLALIIHGASISEVVDG